MDTRTNPPTLQKNPPPTNLPTGREEGTLKFDEPKWPDLEVSTPSEGNSVIVSLTDDSVGETKTSVITESVNLALPVKIDSVITNVIASKANVDNVVPTTGSTPLVEEMVRKILDALSGLDDEMKSINNQKKVAKSRRDNMEELLAVVRNSLNGLVLGIPELVKRLVREEMAGGTACTTPTSPCACSTNVDGGRKSLSDVSEAETFSVSPPVSGNSKLIPDSNEPVTRKDPKSSAGPVTSAGGRNGVPPAKGKARDQKGSYLSKWIEGCKAGNSAGSESDSASSPVAGGGAPGTLKRVQSFLKDKPVQMPGNNNLPKSENGKKTKPKGSAGSGTSARRKTGFPPAKGMDLKPMTFSDCVKIGDGASGGPVGRKSPPAAGDAGTSQDTVAKDGESSIASSRARTEDVGSSPSKGAKPSENLSRKAKVRLKKDDICTTATVRVPVIGNVPLPRQSADHGFTVRKTGKTKDMTVTEVAAQLDKVNPRTHGVAVRRLVCRSNEVRVILRNEHGSIGNLRKAVEALGFATDNLSSERQPRVTIYDVSLQKTSSELEAELNEMGETSWKPTKALHSFRNDLNIRSGTTCWVVEVDGRMRNKLISDGRVQVGWNSCRVADSVRIVMCYRCLGFGHAAKRCNLNPNCSRCGASGHEGRGCGSKDRKCFLCMTAKHKRIAHIPGGKGCLVYERKLKSFVRTVNYCEP